MSFVLLSKKETQYPSLLSDDFKIHDFYIHEITFFFHYSQCNRTEFVAYFSNKTFFEGRVLTGDAVCS